MSINWTDRFRRQTLVGSFLRLPLKALPKGKIMRVRTGPSRGLKWIVGSGIHGCWLGTYELDKQEALKQYIGPDMVIYDIGANSGFYTLFFSQLVGPGGKVYAFEPFPENVQYLVTHTLINQLNNVRVVQAAVGAKTNLVGFTVGCGAYQNHIANALETILSVPQMHIDSFIDVPGTKPPNLIKIDVEGAESRVLEGAQDTLRKYRPIVFLALHGPEQNRTCQALLSDYGYELFSLDGASANDMIACDEIVAVPKRQ